MITLAGTHTYVPAMVSCRLLLLLFTPLLTFAQIDKVFSEKINKRNIRAFALVSNDIRKAEEYSKETLKLIKSKEQQLDLIVRSDCYSVAGTIALERQEYKIAQKLFFKSLMERQKGKDWQKCGNTCMNIANTYYFGSEANRAIHHYRKGLYYYGKAGSIPEDISPLYNGIGLAYEALHRPDLARYYYNKALAAAKQCKDQNTQYIGDLYCNLGQFHETQEEFNQALSYFNKALAIYHHLNDVNGMAWVYHHMGILSDEQHYSVGAKAHFHTADSLAIAQEDLETQRDIAKSWMLLYTREQKTDSVRYYFQLYEQLNDSLSQLKLDENLYEAEAQFKSEKKDIALQTKEREKQYLQITLISITVLALIIFFFLIRNYRQRQRIALMQINLKNREINDLLVQQETASYASMLEGQDKERQRIARDLHDRLGSTLAAVKLSMENPSAEASSHNKLLINNAIDEVRSIAHDLSAGNIEKYGLNAALEELRHTIELSGQLEVHLYLDEKPLTNNSLKIELYRIVQELISNTLKHACASAITIQTNAHGQHFNLIYEDNGKGFDPAEKTDGMGLQNITARLNKLNGHFEVDTKSGRGTIVIINIPQKTET